MAIQYLLLLAGALAAILATVYFPIRWWRNRQTSRPLTDVELPQSDNRAMTVHPQPRWWQRTSTDVVATIILAILVAIGVNDNSVLLAGAITDSIPPDVMVSIVRVLAAAQVAPLAVRRKYPVGSAVAVAAIAAIHTLFRPFPLIVFADVAILIALYNVTAYGPKWAGRAGLFTAFLGAAAIGWRSASFTQIQTGATFALILMLINFTPWALGLMRRAQAAAVSALQEKTNALAEMSEILTERNAALVQRNEALDLHRVNLEYRTRQLAIERNQQAQIATAAERARIAREMHDIVGHAIANIIVLANGAGVAAAKDPQIAVAALSAISESGTEALATTKQLLGVLRAPDAPVALRPEPGNIGSAITEADPIGIHALVNEVRNAGTHVELFETGTSRPLASATTNTFYRVCQEALTNARKYGVPEATVRVELGWEPAILTLTVTNQISREQSETLMQTDGTTISQQPTGQAATQPTSAADQQFGLIGMRERAALISGRLTAGPTQSGQQWAVTLTSSANPIR